MTQVQWDINPKQIQYGTRSVLLTGTGFGANELVHLMVETPTECPYRWELIADASGNISEYIELASGPGRYTFKDGDCHEWVPAAISVMATCCAPAQVGCSLELHVNRTDVQMGNKVTVDVVNGVANTKAVIYQTFNGAAKALPIQLGADGWGTIDVVLEEAGVYSFSAAQGECVTDVTQVVSIGNINDFPTVPGDSCTGVIKVTPHFIVQSVAATASVGLVLTVANSSNQTQVVNIGGITLPLELTSVFPIAITNEPIAPNSARDFTFYLNAVNISDTAQQVPLVIAPKDGSYICNGASRSIVGGSANLYMEAPKKACGIQVTQFTFAPATVTSGQATILVLKVKNIGEAGITNLSLAAIAPPAALSPGNISFAGVPLDAGQEYTYTKQFMVNSTTDLTATITIPAGQLTATCQGSVVSNLSPSTTSLGIKAKQ
jgi:hypothetical protein